MSLDERWIPLLPRLSRLELLVVTRLAAHGGELAVTVSDLAGQLGAHPKNLGGTLRELNGRLVQYRSGWGHRPVARLRLLDPEPDRVAEVRDWLGQRERAALRPLEESRDCSMPGLPKIAAAVLLEESRDGAIPGLLKSDSLLGHDPHVHHDHDHARSLKQLDEGERAVVERLMREVCGGGRARTEVEMWTELFRGRGLTREQLETGVAVVRRRMGRPPRTMHYFRPHLLEVLDGTQGDGDGAGERRAGRPGQRRGAEGARLAGLRDRCREWAADVEPDPPEGERVPEGARRAGEPDL